MAKNILICDDAAFMRMMIKDILTKNGIRPGQISIYGRVRDRKVTEVFPEIREKETTINVRI